MTYIFDKLTGIIYGILALLVVLIVIAAIYIILSKKKGKTRIDEDTTDYATFERKDTTEYVKHIRDIKDDMIITDDGKRFVAVIRCHGFDFYDEDYDVQLQTAQGYMSFINTINKPISYRQYSKPVDLEDIQNRYQSALSSIEEDLYNSQEDLRDISKVLKNDMENLSADERQLYADKIKELEKQVNALKFRKFHVEDQLRVIGVFANGAVTPIPEETYIVEYRYESMDLSVTLSDEEIYDKAKKELESIVNAKIHALSAAHVKSYRCKTTELIDMCRWYSYPVSASRFKQKDLENSSYFDDIQASDSLSRLTRAALDESRAKNEQNFLREVKESAEECAQRAIKKLESVYADAAAEEARMTSGGKAQMKSVTPDNVNATKSKQPDQRVQDLEQSDEAAPGESLVANKKDDLEDENHGSQSDEIIIEEG